jgi:xylulokinase
MAALVLGIDVGTTSTKVVLADPAAGVVAQASEPVALSSPHPGWAEADPAQWWANLAALVPAVLAAASAASGKPVTAADIAAVATTGMVPAVIPVDHDGRPLRGAILQNDARATTEIRELAAALPDLDFVARTGSALTQQSVGPTLLWLARHEPGTSPTRGRPPPRCRALTTGSPPGSARPRRWSGTGPWKAACSSSNRTAR